LERSSRIWAKTSRTARIAAGREHYLKVLKRIREKGLQAEISVKLTQLGLDLSPDLCFEHLNAIIERAQKNSSVWVDMEAEQLCGRDTRSLSPRSDGASQRWCMPAGLSPSTKDDLAKLLPLRPSIRLVKGAYNEPPEIAFPRKKERRRKLFCAWKTAAEGQEEGRCRARRFWHA